MYFQHFSGNFQSGHIVCYGFSCEQRASGLLLSSHGSCEDRVAFQGQGASVLLCCDGPGHIWGMLMLRTCNHMHWSGELHSEFDSHLKVSLGRFRNLESFLLSFAWHLTEVLCLPFNGTTCFSFLLQCCLKKINKNVAGSFQYNSECVCEHNTEGAHCESCLPLFNNRLWQVGRACEGKFCTCTNFTHLKKTIFCPEDHKFWTNDLPACNHQSTFIFRKCGCKVFGLSCNMSGR